MFGTPSVIPFLLFILWVGVIVYAIVLAARLVNAVEKIARAMTRRLPDPQEP